MATLAARLGRAVNWLIVLSALVLAGLLYVRFSGPRPAGIDRLGAKVPFKTVNWQANGRTLLVALGRDCPDCGEGAGFIRKLINESAIRGVSVVALAEPPTDQAKQLLAGLDLEPRQLLVVPFDQLRLKRVPSLILVDAAGTVVGVWRGSIDASREAAVLAALQRRAPGRP
jgi:hypothetical protein